MSMIKRTTLTINKNNTGVKLSSPLNFYKHDNLTLYFEIERYNFELHQYARVVPLSAIAYVETPDGIDSIQATIVEDNLIMFYLTSYHTCNLGKSKLQLVVRDNDGCQCATPPFEFTIYDIINHDTIFTTEDGNIVVSEDDIPLTLEGNSGYNSISNLEEAFSLENSYILVGSRYRTVSSQSKYEIVDEFISKYKQEKWDNLDIVKRSKIWAEEFYDIIQKKMNLPQNYQLQLLPLDIKE